MAIHIINGPNLNLLGKREPAHYGNNTLQDIEDLIRSRYPEKEFHFFQSNHEGELIDFLHKVGFDSEGIVLNAGALTHTSIGIRDAVSAIDAKVIEVHISNIHKREQYRHHSFLSDVAEGSIVGLGTKGYELAVQALIE